MSGASKTLKNSDVQIFPYITNKTWRINTSSYNDLGVRIFTGKNLGGNFYSSSTKTFDSASNESQYQNLLYNSLRHLYYANYTSASYLPKSSSYDNYEQTTIYYTSGSYLNQYNGPLKYFPTSSNSIIRVVSIPQNIFGSKIVPSSFQVSGAMYNIVDDGEGNLLDISGSTISVGNIIYPHGLIIITNPSYSIIFPTSSIDSSISSINQKSGSFNMIFKGEHIIYENEIRCTINEDEFNYTLNPSISTDNSGSLRGFATASYFNPYVTTVGLYNEANQLLAIGKMSKPVPIPRNSDLTFLIKFDN